MNINSTSNKAIKRLSPHNRLGWLNAHIPYSDYDLRQPDSLTFLQKVNDTSSKRSHDVSPSISHNVTDESSNLHQERMKRLLGGGAFGSISCFFSFQSNKEVCFECLGVKSTNVICLCGSIREK